MTRYSLVINFGKNRENDIKASIFPLFSHFLFEFQSSQSIGRFSEDGVIIRLDFRGTFWLFYGRHLSNNINLIIEKNDLLINDVIINNLLIIIANSVAPRKFRRI